tara:strand:+ start:18 stop:623 length:606 start_codon:yes stop_codon:yes gene_type:complete
MSINVCNNNSLSAITSIPASITGGALNLISTQTASSSSTISFTSGIDSTYKIYMFKFISIHPSADDRTFQFNLSADGGSNYNVTKTSSAFKANHDEGDSATNLTYDTGEDLGQSTGFQTLGNGIGGDNDQSISGTLYLFNPSDTTFIKHFIAVAQNNSFNNYTNHFYIAGCGNTTSAINAAQFKFASDNIESGTIKLYGIS